MITFNLRTPDTDFCDDNTGIVGENLSFEEEIVIKGLADSKMSFVFHLRFSDGLVNSVVPESVKVVNGDTHLVWLIKKNDIFSHGYFELQVEGRNGDKIFQTEIVRLCAKESIPIEDKDYENPNSETLALRDEMYELYKDAKECEDFIRENSLMKYTYTKAELKARFGLPLTVTFDENWVPLCTTSSTNIIPGDLYSYGVKEAKYVFVSSSVTRIILASFYHLKNLTDIYIDNERSNITIEGTLPGDIPSGATLHFVDDFNANKPFAKALDSINKQLSNKASNIYKSVDNYIEQSITAVSGSFISEYNGSELEGENFEHTEKISCQSGDKFKVTAAYGYHAPLAVFFNSDGSFHSYYGYNSSALESVTDEVVEIPNGAAYVVFNNATTQATLSVSKNFPVIVYLAEKIDENTAEIERLSSVTSQNTSEIMKKANNIYSNRDSFEELEISVVDGKYAHAETGIYTDSANMQCTESIACAEGDAFRVSSIYGYSAPLAVFYDVDKNFIGYINAISGAWKSTAEAEIITVPANAATVVFNNLGTKATLTVEKGITITLSDKIKANANAIEELKNNSPLYGKTIYCDGDSVAAGAGSDGYSYCDFIADRNNMTMTKKAVGGTTFAIRASRTDSIFERMLSMTGNYDYILFEGGFNDMFNQLDLGEISNSYGGDYDTSTVAGALEKICYFLKTSYPDTKILFVLGHRIIRGSGDTKQLPYWDIYREICKKWSIPYVDIAAESGLIGWKDDDVGYALNDKYFATGSTGHGDGTHPLKDTYEKFYVPLIEAKLKTL